MIKLRRILKRLWLPLALRIWPLARIWYRLWGLHLTGRPGDEVWYFAFGANMNDDVFRGRRAMEPSEWRVGRLGNHRLRFNLEGRPKGKAAPANLEPSEGDVVWGVLYRITRRDMVRLNATEGVPGWRYYPIWVEAEDIAGNPLNAFTLIAEGLAGDGRPSLRYITLLRDGARAHGLPAEWIARLDAVEPAEP